MNIAAKFSHLFSRNNSRIWLLLLFTLFGATNISANNYDFSRARATNQLSHLSVQCMVKDSIGFLWIGTKDGLNRYDGYQYVSYKYDPTDKNTISCNEISCLAVQGDSILWIGTRGGGVNRLCLKNGFITRLINESCNGFINDICVDNNGGVWVGTTVGLFKHDVSNGEFTNVSKGAVFRQINNESFIPSELNTDVQNIFAYKNNSLIISSVTGMFLYDIKGGTFKVLCNDVRYVSVSSDIIEDKYGNLWVANYDGLMMLEPDTTNNNFKFFTQYSGDLGPDKIRSNRVDAAALDKKGNVWFAIEGVGLAMHDGDKIRHHSEIIKDEGLLRLNTINKLFIDDKGILWLGTDDSGLYSIDLSENAFKRINKRSSSSVASDINNVKSVSGRDGNLFFGTLSGQIEQFYFSEDVLTYQKSIPLKYDNQIRSKVIQALLVDGYGHIWIGTTINSLMQYSAGDSVRPYITDGYVYSLMEDDKNNVWYGTWGNGFGYINSKTGRQEVYAGHSNNMLGLSNDVVLAIKETTEGYLLVGTKGGGLNIAPIEKVRKRNTRFRIFKHDPEKESSIAHNDIYKIIETKSGEIWLGTGRGLVKIISAPGESLSESMANGTIGFVEITEKEGLPGGIVTSVCEDQNGYLWVVTNGGLCRYSKQDSSIINFNPEGEELAESYENNAVYFDANSKTMILGGRNGIIYFNPDNVIVKGRSYPVYFTNFTIFNEKIVPGQKHNGRIIIEKEITYTDKIALKYNEKLISFEFSTLTKSPKENIRYKYRLLGFNENWVEVNNLERKITFTNLKHGQYTLQVKASNTDGSWPEAASEMKIMVNPPFWLTPWAFFGYIALILFLLLAYRKYTLIRLKEKNLLHIQELEHRKEVEISEAKIRFFTNVSHEIRTPLTLIYEPLRQLSSHKRLPEGAKELTDMMMRNMKRLLNQVNRLLELRKLDGGEYVINYSIINARQIITRIMYDFEVGIKNKGIEVQYNIPDNIQLKADRQLLDTVLYNIISNAIKFLPNENGRLKIDVLTNEQNSKIKAEFVQISISDNGPGIPEEELKSVFELFYQSTGVVQSNVGGTGIGLAIVKEYIDYHKGTVAVSNLKHGGCRFDITLPINLSVSDALLRDEQLKNELDVTASSSFAEYLSEVTQGNLLSMVIVEDDVDLASYLKRVFKAQFNVTHFSEGQSALDNMAEIMPDIIISDLMMPKLNGMALTEKLKTNAETSHIPIVMLTAKSEDESKIKGFKIGADSYLVKPFNTEILVAQVGAIIKSRNAFKERFSQNLVLEPKESVVVPAEKKFIKKIMGLTEARLDDSTFEVNDIVSDMGMSHSLLLRKFKAATGMSLVEFIRSMRIKKAMQYFKQDKFTVAEVAYKVGFSDPKYFSKCFAKEVGERPSVFIQKHHN